MRISLTYLIFAAIFAVSIPSIATAQVSYSLSDASAAPRTSPYRGNVRVGNYQTQQQLAQPRQTMVSQQVQQPMYTPQVSVPAAPAAEENGLDITLGGWMSAGFTTYDTGMFNNNPDQFNLNQAWFYAEKVADGSEGFGWGFRIDYMYGTDGPDTQAFGNPAGSWDEGWDNGGFYGHAIPQLYAEFATGDVSVKVGHFYTLIGYEVVTAPDNFFYSHAFTMYNSEPFTHTGALATADLGDVTAYGGYVFGWDTGFDENDGSQFIGGLSYGVGENITFTYIALVGDIGFGSDLSGYNHSLVADITLTEELQWVIQSDYVDYSGTGPDLLSYGVNTYMFYDLSESIKLGARAEWWNTEIAPGNIADLYGFTFGANLQLTDNVVIRPEARYDIDEAGVLIPAGDNEQLGFGIDAVISFGG